MFVKCIDTVILFYSVLLIIQFYSARAGLTQRQTFFALRNLTSRLIGGKSAISRIHFPHQVSLRFSNKFGPYEGYHICSGSIITGRWVLTAGHCLYNPTSAGIVNFEPEDIVVIAGEVTLDTILTGVPKSNIRSVCLRILHYDWHRPNPDIGCDIALLQLTRPWDFSISIKPISMVNFQFPKYNRCLVTGWGTSQNYLQTAPSFLQYVDAFLFDNSECQKKISTNQFRFTDKLVCAGRKTDEAFYSGDSGGPLVCQCYLVGITSQVRRELVTEDFPGIFTSIFYHREWVISELRKAKHCDLVPRRKAHNVSSKPSNIGTSSTGLKKSINIFFIIFGMIFTL